MTKYENYNKKEEKSGRGNREKPSIFLDAPEAGRRNFQKFCLKVFK